MKKKNFSAAFVLCLVVTSIAFVSCNQQQPKPEEQTATAVDSAVADAAPLHQANTVEITRSGIAADSAAKALPATQWGVTVIVTTISNAGINNVETNLQKMTGQQCTFDSTLNTNSNGVAYYHEDKPSPCTTYKARARHNGVTQTATNLHDGDVVRFYY